MKNKLLVLAVLFMSTFTLFGQGNGNLVNDIVPFVRTGGCDEPVTVTGVLHVIYDEQVSAAGVYKGRIHFNIKATGFGEFTGAKYEYNEVVNEFLHLAAGEVYSFNRRFRVIGQGKASDFFLDDTFHVTVNANGTLTVITGSFKAGCE